MDEGDVVYTHNGILPSSKREGILSFVTTWMDLEGFMPNEIDQMKMTNTA